jgi:hypothetical protein
LSFNPEYAQSDLPFSGALSEPAIHLPLPVISPANAEPAATVASAAATRAGDHYSTFLEREVAEQARRKPAWMGLSTGS